ncbi:MAG: nucleoside hydrolase [Pseudomonadota bacterium]
MILSVIRRIGIGLLGVGMFGFAYPATAFDCAPSGSDSEPPQIIFDTDFGGDADDLGAIAMLHHYADRDMLDLRAIISWSHEEYAMPALAAVNRYYGRPRLPLAVRKSEIWRTEWNYTKPIADRFPHDRQALQDVLWAVPLYRQILAEASAHEITIVTVGPLANIRDLLESGPDENSPLSGKALVDEKVRCLVVMGGQFPDGRTASGAEWNFDGNMPGVTQAVLENIDRPIIFSGYEVGEALKVGKELNDHPKTTPLYEGYLHFSEYAPWIKDQFRGEILDNSSFDQTAVMFAALPDSDRFWSLSPRGKLRADTGGMATWEPDPDGNHRYLILDGDRHAAEAEILSAMTHIPG